MNKQAVYITQAHILLAGLAATFWVVSKISSADETNNYKQETVQQKLIDYTASPAASKGRSLFMSKCASCHNLVTNTTGPALGGVIERGPWSDRKELYKWIRNPEIFMQTNAYTRELKKQYVITMTPFPNLSDSDIDAIIEYTNFNGTTSIP